MKKLILLFIPLITSSAFFISVKNSDVPQILNSMINDPIYVEVIEESKNFKLEDVTSNTPESSLIEDLDLSYFYSSLDEYDSYSRSFVNLFN